MNHAFKEYLYQLVYEIHPPDEDDVSEDEKRVVGEVVLVLNGMSVRQYDWLPPTAQSAVGISAFATVMRGHVPLRRLQHAIQLCHSFLNR